MNPSRKLLAGLALGGLATAASLACERLGWLERLEAISWDARVRTLAHPVAQDVSIRLVLIDQASLDWMAKENQISWPWPRELYATIIDYCTKAGAKSVAIDIRFEDPSSFGEEDDQKLIAALKAAPRVGLPVLPDPGTGAGVTKWPGDPPPVPPERQLTGFADLPTAMSLAMSTPEITAAASALGHVRGAPDVDGVVRRIQPAIRFDSRLIPSLGLTAAPSPFSDNSVIPPDVQPGDSQYLMHRIPQDADGKAILNFPATQPAFNGHMFPAYGAAAIIQSAALVGERKPPTIDPAEFKDRTVFIAFSAPALYDLVPTPGNPLAPGVEVHATTLLNLQQDSFIREASRSAVAAAAFAIAALAALLMLNARRTWSVAALLAAAIATPVFAGVFAFENRVWWPIVAPELAGVLSLLAALTLNYATEGRQRRFIRRAFQQYLSPAVIDRLTANPAQLVLGGERRELSIFFSDIQGFTSISERLDSQVLTALLNDCLSDLSEIILEEGGTIDKYIGDAIVAFWNAPLDQPDHALRACRAALRCQKRLAERRDEFAARAGAPLIMRIGVNTGQVAVGNMGSQQRFNYTVLGNAANLASRLEGANKAFGTNLMVAESTWLQLRDALAGREIGVIRVVGKDEPIRAYEILGLPDDPPPASLDVRSYREAMTLFRAGRLREALNAFGALQNDPLAQRYASKLAHVLAGEDPTWDGVWNLTEK